MKKSTIYGLLLMGLLVGISYLYDNINKYDEPYLIASNGGECFKTIQVGDLYLVKNEKQQITQFFKVVGNPNSDSISIAIGNPSYNHHFTTSNWIKKGIDRPIYFDPNLQKVASTFLSSNHRENTTFKVYRQKYPPDQFSLPVQVLNSPIGVIILLLLYFFLIWILDLISLYLSSRFQWLPKVVVLSLLSCGIIFTLYGYQFRGAIALDSYLFPVPSIVNMDNLLNPIVESLPIFLLFHFLKTRYFQQLNFTEQELGKFLSLLIFGVLSQLIMVTLLYWVQSNYSFPGINSYRLDLMGYSSLTKLFLVNWGLFAIANFLNNLRKHLNELRFQTKRLIKSEQKVLTFQSELDTLQAKVNPHFLYNALNSIASLAQTSPSKTESMALALSNFYKYSINRKESPWSTLGEELQLLKTYLGIEKIRFGERLHYTMETEEALHKQLIPHFLLQPLVENAVKYGFNKTSNQIVIGIKTFLLNKQLHIKITDSGPLFSGQLNTGYGLRSVKKKLKLLYPNQHEIHFMNSPEKHVYLIIDFLIVD